MSAAHKFDSLEYSNRLRKAGFTEDQANVQATALFSVIEEQLLTKQDLKELETKVNYGFQDMKRDIKESELRLFVRLIGTITVIMSILGAVLKFLPNVH
jgi:hypothetical protein